MPSVRVAAADLALFAAETVYAAGIPVVEITMTVPGGVDVISQLSHKHPDIIVGAGTVLDVETAQRCVDAGARFLTSPGFVPAVVEFAVQKGIVVLPGALTPTEVITAWKAGSDFVKIFPCDAVGSHHYIHTLKVPLPQIPLIASGGVTQHTAFDFISAGASALGIGTQLIPVEALHKRNRAQIHELSRRFLATVKEARAKVDDIL